VIVQSQTKSVKNNVVEIESRAKGQPRERGLKDLKLKKDKNRFSGTGVLSFAPLFDHMTQDLFLD